MDSIGALPLQNDNKNKKNGPKSGSFLTKSYLVERQ